MFPYYLYAYDSEIPDAKTEGYAELISLLFFLTADKMYIPLTAASRP